VRIWGVGVAKTAAMTMRATPRKLRKRVMMKCLCYLGLLLSVEYVVRGRCRLKNICSMDMIYLAARGIVVSGSSDGNLRLVHLVSFRKCDRTHTVCSQRGPNRLLTVMTLKINVIMELTVR
jgi:hypothetical protein